MRVAPSDNFCFRSRPRKRRRSPSVAKLFCWLDVAVGLEFAAAQICPPQIFPGASARCGRVCGFESDAFFEYLRRRRLHTDCKEIYSCPNPQ